MLLNRLHFGQRQKELTLSAELLQAGVVHVAQRNFDPLEVVRAARFEAIEFQRTEDHLLDGVIGQHLRRQCGQFVVRYVCKPEFPERPDRLDRQPQISDRRLSAQRHGVHHTGFG